MVETINVVGMNCGHCVQSVTTELMKLDGIQGVEVDLATGAVAINATAPLDRAAVAGAIDEAGFDLAA